MNSHVSRRYERIIRGNSHDQQAARSSCGKIDVDLVVGKGESFKHVVTNGPKNVPERVLS